MRVEHAAGRLVAPDAPEVRGATKAEGIKSRDWLREQLLGKKVTIQTLKDKKGKYGRYLVEVYLDGVNLNDRLVELGLARLRDY